MKRLLFTLAAAILLAGSAFAAGPGEDKAVPSATATSAEKAGAKAARKAEGKAVAQASQPGDDRPASASKKASKSDRQSAAAQRKTEGAKVSKQPKEAAGPN